MNLPPPQKRAALNILPEYRGLKLSELTDSDPPPEKEEEEKDPQAVLLSKIANLRKAINEVGTCRCLYLSGVIGRYSEFRMY